MFDSASFSQAAFSMLSFRFLGVVESPMFPAMLLRRRRRY